ncbi:MAG: methionyl-tRNA formyltransferase [Dermatophilaceae bacterium]
MRVVFAGTPEVAVPSLDALLASSHEVVAVLTRPDAPSGRGRALRPSSVKKRAMSAGVPVLAPASAKDPELASQVERLRADVCAVVAYGQILPRALLDVPVHGWINLHFSLLPAWRGAAPVQRALIAGDDVTGATTFVIEDGLDCGPVLGTMTEEVRPDDTAGTLLDRLARAGADLLVASLDAVQDGRVEPVPQPVDGITLAPKVSVDDARIRWNDPALGVDRRIRGCTPAPGAWTVFRGQRVKLGPVRPLALGEARDAVPPGRLLVTRHEVLTGTATTPVRLGEVQVPGKRPMPAPDWARGARIEPGEGFASDGADSA